VESTLCTCFTQPIPTRGNGLTEVFFFADINKTAQMPLPYCLGQSRIPVNRLSEKKSISLVFLSNSSKKNLIESVFEKTSR